MKITKPSFSLFSSLLLLFFGCWCFFVCGCVCVCVCVCVAIILVYNLSPLSWGNYLKGKKDKAKSVHEARYSRMQIMTLKGTTRGKCFESMSFQFAWFSLKLRIKLYHTLETFYLSSFYECYLKTLASSRSKMYRKPIDVMKYLMSASTGI